MDMDAFFAACEERYNPQLRGKPVVIGADPKSGTGRGVVSTANYAARKYGIKLAMPISRAWRAAEEARKRGEPETVFLQGNCRLYSEVSERITAIAAKYGDAFEQASIDEAYVEWKFETGNSKLETDLWKIAEERAKAAKEKIFEQEGLACSVGIGPNKLVAKIASDFKKPGGFTIVRTDEVETFLKPLSIGAISGIGPKTEATLNKKGIRTIAELRQMPREELATFFGAWGDDLYDKARGIDDSLVSNEWEAQSVGEQETFDKDTLDSAFILGRAKALAGEVFSRLHRKGFQSFRTIVLTVRFADFATTTRSRTHPSPLTTEVMLNGALLKMLLPFLDRRENPKQKKIRLVGVRVEKLSHI